MPPRAQRMVADVVDDQIELPLAELALRDDPRAGELRCVESAILPEVNLGEVAQPHVDRAATGRDDDGDMAVILSLSEHTVHNIVRRAMKKYGVASRMQAFVRALKDGQIRLEDVA